MDISINTKKLKDKAQNLETLARNIDNRKLNISFSRTSGELSGALEEAAAVIKNTGSELASLIRVTASKFTAAAEIFDQADQEAAEIFKS